MAKIDLYPLGSIVRVNGQPKRLMIVSRGLSVKHPKEGMVYFDYGGVEYPDGLVGVRICYFNHDMVRELVYAGYDDEDNRRTAEFINNYVQEHPELKRLRT